MALKETPRSLQVYLLLVGVVSTLSVVKTFRSFTEFGMESESVALANMLIDLAIGVGFLWAGITLNAQLAKGATWIKRMLVTVIVIQVVSIVLTAVQIDAELAVMAYVFGGIRIAISVYLLASVKRLSAEAQRIPPAALA